MWMWMSATDQRRGIGRESERERNGEIYWFVVVFNVVDDDDGDDVDVDVDGVCFIFNKVECLMLFFSLVKDDETVW